MPNNFFITGMPQSGKTTLLRDLAIALLKKGVNVGGFISPVEKKYGVRESFFVEDIETRKTAPLAIVGGNGPLVGKYNVDVKSFESIVMRSLNNAAKYDVIIVDEIGHMEMKSTAFQDALADLMVSNTPVIASIQGSYVNTYGIYGRVYNLTDTNKGMTYDSILRNILKVLGPATKVSVKKVEAVTAKAPKPEVRKKVKALKKAKPAKVQEQKHNKPVKLEGKEGKKGLLHSIKKLFGI